MALLTAEALGFGDRYSLQTDFLQRLLHFIELERFDDRLDFFHRVPSPGSQACKIRRGTDPWLAGPMPMLLIPGIHTAIRCLWRECTIAAGLGNQAWLIN